MFRSEGDGFVDGKSLFWAIRLWRFFVNYVTLEGFKRFRFLLESFPSRGDAERDDSRVWKRIGFRRVVTVGKTKPKLNFQPHLVA